MVDFSPGDLLADRRGNALVAWLFVLFLGIVVAESVADGDIPWALFVVGIIALCLVPTVTFRDSQTMLPWEVVALAALPTFGQAITPSLIPGAFLVYISIAALALIVAVELELFTDVEMTIGFAIGFVILATLAAAGVGAVIRWRVDLLFDTTTLLKPGVSEQTIHDELMIEFLYSALAGLFAGVIFQIYFRRTALNERFYSDMGKP
ncbi:hypothetical protein ACFQJ7_16635 [Halovenus rubra]|uniref:Uncharacterized protein n=2 Tax=Halovenus rubra TaxID=869890 RepID=A0ACC7DWL1_9EURY|nr:hypothetical protein [Halovenus rubra]